MKVCWAVPTDGTARNVQGFLPFDRNEAHDVVVKCDMPHAEPKYLAHGVPGKPVDLASWLQMFT